MIASVRNICKARCGMLWRLQSACISSKQQLPRNWTSAYRETQRSRPTAAAVSIERIEMGPRLSEAVKHNGTVYISGQVGEKPTTGIVEQTRSMLRSVDELLVKAGSDRDHILSATIFLQDMDDFETMNTVWDQWIPQWHTPARAVVESAKLPRGVKIEISIIAAEKKQ
mmetsp:Transcript_20963/g.30222  ORF Transcript_20963/g.30222 Transcript_20963/m.30222 type:complete len:169 (+) Transcript_20963:63-569(+)